MTSRTQNAEPADPVLDSLQNAEVEYAEMRAAWESDANELKRLRSEYARLENRARQVGEAVKRIHSAMFDGGVPEMILRSSIVLTGATRGVYLTARDDVFRVRAVLGMDPYRANQPSEFLEALARKAVAQHDTIVCNHPDTSLPAPDVNEQFSNCAAVPVTMMDNLDGVIIVADKIPGGFDEDDVEAVLSVGDHARVAVRNVSLERELQNAYLATVSMLADAVEAKDPYTRGHCETASRYARLTGKALALRDHDRESLCYAALLHDVGKIGVSDGILNKPGPLLPEERQVVESHVRIGYDLIRSVPVLSDVAEIVLHHHEWYDGNGYPNRLSGEEIPMGARVVAVVDAYCAMLDRRAYKDALSEEEARAELQRCAGTQFDPAVVQAFLRALDEPDAFDQDEDNFAECGPLPSLLQLFKE
jgi:HD-GYP domain-containing protein (c-di-GMP phosphodiesterase class II)